MALANYADLIAAIPNWSARSDLTSRIPEFVTLAESDFNRELRVGEMLVNNPNFVIGGEFVNAPAGFLEVKDWYTNASPRAPLLFMPDDTMTAYYNSSDIAQFYSISGTQFRFAPTPGAGTSTTLRYFQAIPGLQANSTNWLMTAHPNMYLFNVLMQLALYISDGENAQKWLQAWQTELQSLKSHDGRRRYGGTGMAVRAL